CRHHRKRQCKRPSPAQHPLIVCGRQKRSASFDCADGVQSRVCVMSRFANWIQSFALALGGPGLFIVGFLDSSFLSLPEINDLLLIWMVTQHKARMPYYATAAMLGSVAGCLVLYYLGRVSEQWVARRFSAERMERTMKTFQRYGVMAVLI